MLKTTLLAVTLVALPLVGGKASAQTSNAQATGQPDPATARFLARMPTGMMRGAKLTGVDVIGSDIRKLGDVRDLLIDRDGKVLGVLIGVGGFLGVGEKTIAVPFDALLWNFGNVSPTSGPSASTEPGRDPAAGGTAAATGSAGDKAATVPVTGDGVPQHAVLHMTRSDLQNAPEFRADQGARATASDRTNPPPANVVPPGNAPKP